MTCSSRAWICSALVSFLVLGACTPNEECDRSAHCEGNTAVRCEVGGPHFLFWGVKSEEREECDDNRRCVEGDEAGPTSDYRIPTADCR